MYHAHDIAPTSATASPALDKVPRNLSDKGTSKGRVRSMTTTTTKRRSQYKNETATRLVTFDGDRLLRQIGVAVVTGALTLSMIPTAALAESSSASSTNTGSTTSSAQPQAPSGDSQGSSTPPAPPSGGSKGTAPNTQGQPPSDHAQPPSGSMSQGQPPAGGMGGANTQTFGGFVSPCGWMVASPPRWHGPQVRAPEHHGGHGPSTSWGPWTRPVARAAVGCRGVHRSATMASRRNHRPHAECALW